MRETWRYGARVSLNRTTIDQPPLETEQKIVAPDQLSTDSPRLEPLYAPISARFTFHLPPLAIIGDNVYGR